MSYKGRGLRCFLTRKAGRALVFSIVLQTIVFVASAYITDFGEINIWVCRSVIAFWPLVGWMALKRWSRLTSVDFWYLRWGFLCIVLWMLMFGDATYFLIHRWITFIFEYSML